LPLFTLLFKQNLPVSGRGAADQHYLQITVVQREGLEGKVPVLHREKVVTVSGNIRVRVMALSSVNNLLSFTPLFSAFVNPFSLFRNPFSLCACTFAAPK
jgi:hypothetical protein